ncbi:type III polyketide synthase [Croceivirga thetidis]|uniref:Type III polyketide synthase n=1 Tax=Croceivirga thetidis TaxID=2721623 RepID=A0ABX1GUE2_9FLAO|nr:3-oxoacyl-[acyl-carrier-protein] synthase III C-terminal domain-containing protein [Croceivirga thetidis]NKI32367.1 type III polyketide synthase [Croceivirga thetidis]
MTNTHIVGVSKALPPYTRSTNEIIPYIQTWLENEDDRFRRKITKIFEGAGVDKRYGIMPIEEVFTTTSFEEKNKVYEKSAKELGAKALQKALDDQQWNPESLDFIITVSCTGIMIPSLDAYLINSLGLRTNIVRLPVTEMGCAAGVSGLIYAYNFLRANPGKRAAIVAFESATATFQHNDFSMANMVSAAIFGDGAACVLLSSEKEAAGPKIIDGEMYHYPESTHLMGFDMTNTGLQMILDPKVPERIATDFEKVIYPFIEQNNRRIEDVDHLIFHPGGKKIVQAVETLFGEMGKNINETKEVLREYGNMSSVTVLYVLQKFLHRNMAKGELGLILSFGPGFSAQRVLIEW